MYVNLFLNIPILHSFPKETQHSWSCVSFGEECIPVNLGLCIILTMLICRFLMTPGYITLTLGPRKNLRRKVAFLLEKTVPNSRLIVACKTYSPPCKASKNGVLVSEGRTNKRLWTKFRPGFGDKGVGWTPLLEIFMKYGQIWKAFPWRGLINLGCITYITWSCSLDCLWGLGKRTIKTHCVMSLGLYFLAYTAACNRTLLDIILHISLS